MGIIVMKTYEPKVGEGAALSKACVEFNEIIVKEGWPPLELWKRFEGPHNAVTTVQRWDSFSEYEKAMSEWVKTPSIRSGVFDLVYPTNATSYPTTFFYDSTPTVQPRS